MPTPTFSQIEAWQDQLQAITRSYVDAFSQLNAEALNWQPNPKQWSIGQIIEHIIMVNSSYFEIPEKIRSRQQKYPFLARFDFYPRMMGNMIHKSVLPETRRKQSTLPIWEPSHSQVSADILAQFQRHQQELAQFIEDHQEMIANDTLVCSPANKMIVYTLGKAFEIMISHEERHLEQALEVQEAMSARATN